jgi:hypothetical protein
MKYDGKGVVFWGKRSSISAIIENPFGTQSLMSIDWNETHISQQ